MLQILESQLGSLRDLASQFEVTALVNQCDDIMERFKLNKKLFDSDKRVEISYPKIQPGCSTVFPSGLPVNVQRLKQLQCSGEFSDVCIYIQGHGFVAHVHKIILSLWSMPFERVSNCYYRISSHQMLSTMFLLVKKMFTAKLLEVTCVYRFLLGHICISFFSLFSHFHRHHWRCSKIKENFL